MLRGIIIHDNWLTPYFKLGLRMDLLNLIPGKKDTSVYPYSVYRGVFSIERLSSPYS